MKRNVTYKYNPDTDNFERIYPSFKSRIIRGAIFMGCSLLVGIAIFVIFYYGMGTPDEESLREENSRLKSQYNVLNRRLDNSLKIMTDIQNRDDNFYRVMMQMEPMSHSQRYASGQ